MSQLNGAYYGPAIPSQKSYHRPGRGGGCRCCCGCLFSLIFKLILTVIIIVGIAAFLFWLIVRPNVVKVHVTDATLTEFNYTNNTLRYDLALNITVQLPVPGSLLPGAQDHERVEPRVQGEHILALNADQSAEFKKENATGLYEIDVKMYLRVRFKLGVFKTKTLKPKISCDLRVPIKGTATAFETTKCDWDR
ncbi:hypothetical protein ACSQ67_001752 [Phaseolus vulgaris]